MIPPSTADKDKLVLLGSDIVDSWYTGTADEFYNSSTRIWEWNAAEAGNNDDWDQRLGLSALCSSLYRLKRPRNIAERQLWRRLALETVDKYFVNQQDGATGGLFRTNVGNLVAEAGTVTFFALGQIAIILKNLGEGYRTRWATQIAAALDYTTSRGDETYFTNGNIMLLKLIGYELGAYVTGDGARRTKVENLWSFTVAPEVHMAGLGQPNLWRGAGFIDDGNGKGYFSETTTTGSGIDITATNRLDWIYTDAQANYAAMGYLLYSDLRYATYSNYCTRKMMERWNFTTNQFDYSGGSRNAGPGVRNCTGLSLFVGGWIQSIPDFAAVCSGVINEATQGLDVDFRRYLTQTHSTFVRGFGFAIATAIIAAHLKTF